MRIRFDWLAFGGAVRARRFIKCCNHITAPFLQQCLTWQFRGRLKTANWNWAEWVEVLRPNWYVLNVDPFTDVWIFFCIVMRQLISEPVYSVVQHFPNRVTKMAGYGKFLSPHCQLHCGGHRTHLCSFRSSMLNGIGHVAWWSIVCHLGLCFEAGAVNLLRWYTLRRVIFTSFLLQLLWHCIERLFDGFLCWTLSHTEPQGLWGDWILSQTSVARWSAALMQRRYCISSFLVLSDLRLWKVTIDPVKELEVSKLFCNLLQAKSASKNFAIQECFYFSMTPFRIRSNTTSSTMLYRTAGRSCFALLSNVFRMSSMDSRANVKELLEISLHPEYFNFPAINSSFSLSLISTWRFSKSTVALLWLQLQSQWLFTRPLQFMPLIWLILVRSPLHCSSWSHSTGLQGRVVKLRGSSPVDPRPAVSG